MHVKKGDFSKWNLFVGPSSFFRSTKGPDHAAAEGEGPEQEEARQGPQDDQRANPVGEVLPSALLRGHHAVAFLIFCVGGGWVGRFCTCAVL